MNIQKIFKLVVIAGFLSQNFCQAAKKLKKDEYEKSKKILLKKINTAKDLLQNSLDTIENLSDTSDEDRFKIRKSVRIALNLASKTLLPNSVREALKTGKVSVKIKKSYSK